MNELKKKNIETQKSTVKLKMSVVTVAKNTSYRYNE